ncbi:unnamed protein product, partial [Menidia menidia]
MDAREEALGLLNSIWRQALPSAHPVELGAFFIIFIFMDTEKEALTGCPTGRPELPGFQDGQHSWEHPCPLQSSNSTCGLRRRQRPAWLPLRHNLQDQTQLTHSVPWKKDEGHDEPVEPQHLGEDQDQDHAHEEPGLLGGASHAGVAHDADGEPGGQPAQAHTQTGPQTMAAEAPITAKKGEYSGLSSEDILALL